MFLRYNLFAILWILLILLLGLAPGESMPATNIWDFLSFDKVAHFSVFAILAFLLIIGFTKQYTFRFVRYKAEILAIVFSVIYGIAIEVAQSFIPGRGVEYADVFANSLGALSGWLIFYLIYKA
ncbi:VanZ family protein [Marivirga sp. S37H4]|uniref:VanZ family protein n=1 Tax=Marivirga aurantiaca TaxID=2802615 RepID=A0A934WYL4_9BACT|nr:VanZ family protein [Marivirga aurantiaca]MBK6265186.1 VanZ family protein [Marivirga aurantiaca]